MATILLSEAKKLGLDDLSAGVAETVSTADTFTTILPFNITQGNAYAYNREGVPGNVGAKAIGGATTDVKTQVTFAQVSMPLVTIIGDAEVNGLIMAQGVGTTAGADPRVAAVASKAKQIGREYMRLVAVGNSASPGTSVSGVTNTQEFDGIETMFTSDAAFAAQSVDKTDTALTLDMLDELLHLVLVGNPQWIMGNGRVIRKIKSLLRALGGTTYTEIAGRKVDAYEGIPLLRNDYLTADTSATAGVQSDIYAGSFDDGTRTGGASGVIPQVGGVVVQDIGPAEAGDYDITRVKMYGTFAIHSPLAVARLRKVTV